MFVVATFALLVGCAGVPERPDGESASVPWPGFAPPKPGETTYRVDPAASRLRIRVDPEGPMARLGHSHVIGGNAISGTVVLNGKHESTRLDLSIDASALDVDRPEWRAAEGLETELDDAAISGTRANMRGERVLDVANHPEISIRSLSVDGPAWLPDVTARIRLRGEIREVVVPIAVERTERRLIASGAIDLLQSDFGIQPFSTAGGALRVSDRMRIRFRIVADLARNE
ncbi:MAG TPA: YceI family protein [Wenzhouxiangellaceae bacterium]|nr:YceI family protein [Wenzhouxiangellaceae bacterium]